MRRVLMQWLVEHGVNPWIVPNYWFMLCLSLILGSLLTIRLWRKQGGEIQTATDLLFWGIPALLVGAKLLYVAQFGLSSWRGWSESGFSLYGGLLGVLAAWGLIYLMRPYPVRRFLDSATPSLALGLFLTRIGCFLAGCNGGAVTDLPWGARFPPGTSVHSLQVTAGLLPAESARSMPVHPTQLYESFFGLLCFGLLYPLLKHRQFEGQVFFTGMLWYSAYRFMTEFIRADNGGLRPFGIFSFAQLVSLLIFGAALWFILRRSRNRTSIRGGTPEMPRG